LFPSKFEPVAIPVFFLLKSKFLTTAGGHFKIFCKSYINCLNIVLKSFLGGALMDNLSAFDMIGPVMIGPSSSHTAGAVRIGNLAKEIVNNEYQEIKIYFHGSFKETYKGHGTDRAIIGGLLGYKTDDPKIKDSLKKSQKFEF